MARKVRNADLESRTSRLRLTPKRKPYTGPSLARGIMLLYRRNRSAGSWVVKVANGHGAYWTKAIGDADDFEAADGSKILDFDKAKVAALKLARGADDAGIAADSAPITVDGALAAYALDLEARGAGSYNGKYPSVHLTAALLAKPVMLLTAKELRAWRDSLLEKISPATISRVCKCLAAALALAAQHDERIKNKHAWTTGLASLPDSQSARNVILPDHQVRAFVTAAYDHDPKLGLLVDFLAVTGARPSQAVRLLVEDLQDGPKPIIRMPKSGKGGGRKVRYPLVDFSQEPRIIAQQPVRTIAIDLQTAPVVGKPGKIYCDLLIVKWSGAARIQPHDRYCSGLGQSILPSPGRRGVGQVELSDVPIKCCLDLSERLLFFGAQCIPPVPNPK